MADRGYVDSGANGNGCGCAFMLLMAVVGGVLWLRGGGSWCIGQVDK